MDENIKSGMCLILKRVIIAIYPEKKLSSCCLAHCKSAYKESRLSQKAIVSLGRAWCYITTLDMLF